MRRNTCIDGKCLKYLGQPSNTKRSWSIKVCPHMRILISLKNRIVNIKTNLLMNMSFSEVN